MDSQTVQIISDIAGTILVLVLLGARRYTKKSIPGLVSALMDQAKSQAATPEPKPRAEGNSGNGNGNGTTPLLLALVNSETRRVEIQQERHLEYFKTKLLEQRMNVDGVSIRVGHMENDWPMLKALVNATRDTVAAHQTKIDAISKLAVDLDELKQMVAKLIPPPEPPPEQSSKAIIPLDESKDVSEGKAA